MAYVKLNFMPNRNRLFYGDNLKVLRDHISSSSVDLVYVEAGSAPQGQLEEAASAGSYHSPAFPDTAFPRMQILTIEEMLSGRGIQFPRTLQTTFKQAPKAKSKSPENLLLDLT
jgi:hypothetical protein